MKLIKLILLIISMFFSSTFAFSGEQTPIHIELINSVKFGRVEAIKKAIDNDINLSTKNTLLFFASNYNQKDIVKLLLEAKADVNAPYKEGITPLYIASELGHTEIVKLLLEAKADVNVADKNGATMLYMATAKNHTEIVKLLLEAKADVNAPYKDDITPLLIACTEGNVEIVKLLLAAGANVNAKAMQEGKYYSPMRVAKEKNYDQIIQLLTKYGSRE